MAEMLLLDVEKQEVREVEASSLEEYYKLLNCSCIDIVTRNIMNTKYKTNTYDIICDDEALLKEGSIPSAFDLRSMKIGLVGNLLICNYDEEGNEKSLSLTKEDKEFLKDSFVSTRCRMNGSEEIKKFLVLCLWSE